MTEMDIEGFHAALDRVARESRFLSFLAAPPLEVSAAFVRGGLTAGNAHVVAVDGAEVVGWCDVTPVPRPLLAHGGVLGMGLLAEWQGKGIGSALIRTAMAAARQRGLARIELTVSALNQRAITLYERVGFEREGLKRDASLIDGVYSDSLLMAHIDRSCRPSM